MEKPRTESLNRKTRTVAQTEPVYFGVHWERPTVAIFNAIVQDVIAYKTILSNGSHLVVVSENPKFLKRVCAALGVACMSSKAAKATTWKVYYETEAAAFKPDGAQTIYTKKVALEKGKQPRLVKDDPRYPSLYNPADHVMLPPGKNPNINRIPPRNYLTPMTPSNPLMQLW